VQIIRNKETDNLMKDPKAFMLLLQIAYKTRRSEEFEIPNVEVGEAYINGHESVGLKNADEYKYAIKRLKKWGFASFRRVWNGYVAKVTTDKFFTIL